MFHLHKATIWPVMEWHCQIWAGALACHPSLLDRIQRHAAILVGQELASSLEPLSLPLCCLFQPFLEILPHNMLWGSLTGCSTWAYFQSVYIGSFFLFIHYLSRRVRLWGTLLVIFPPHCITLVQFTCILLSPQSQPTSIEEDGLRNAAQMLQRWINDIIHGLPFVYAYLDNLPVTSPTEEEHKAHLRLLFKAPC